MSEAHAHMPSWALPLVITSVLVIPALIYLRGWFCLRNAVPTLIPGWRLAAFMSGLFLAWTAVGSPFAALDHRSLTIHMVKHLLLMTVAAPLILVGVPVFPLVCGFPKLFIKRVTPPANLPIQSLERCLSHPVSCWIAGTGAVIGWHLPVAFQLSMRSHWVHNVEHACFLMAGLLFWWPIVQPSPGVASSPRWSMVMYLFLATLPCDILSAFLVFCNRLVYPFYLSTPPLFGSSPLPDQECAGALMWVWVTFAYLIPAVVLTVRILSPSNAQAQRPMQAARQAIAGRSLNVAQVR